MLKSHAHAHAHNVNVDLQRNSSGNTLNPSYSTSSVSSSMYTFQCVVSITYNHDILLKMAKAPLISYIPSQFCGTVKAFGPYPTPIDVHLSTSPVDKSSPVDCNAMKMRENTSVLLWYLPSVKSPLWKPLCKIPYMETPLLWYIPFINYCSPWSRRSCPLLSIYRMQSCTIPLGYHKTSYGVIVWYITTHGVTLDVHCCVTWRYQMSPLQAKSIAAVSIVSRVMQSLFCSYN